MVHKNVNERLIMQTLRKISYWLFFLFLLYLAFELLRKVLGGSLAFETLMIGLLLANLGYSFSIKESLNRIDSKITGHLGWHKGKDV